MMIRMSFSQILPINGRKIIFQGDSDKGAEQNMSVREKFDYELNSAQDQLIGISKMAVEALSKSVKALLTHDVDAALEVIEDDVEINKLEEEINDQVILMIAKQSPVATDLRRLIVKSKVASD